MSETVIFFVKHRAVLHTDIFEGLICVRRSEEVQSPVPP